MTDTPTPKYTRKPNGLAEDMGAIIGFSNTLLICGTRGGRTLYVPEAATPGHLLETLIGPAAFARMVEAWGGETLTLPALSDFHRYQRIRRCAQWLTEGRSIHNIALLNGVTYNQTKNDRKTAELLGLLPLVFKGRTPIPDDDKVIQQLGFEGF